jgi:hypothetical protein
MAGSGLFSDQSPIKRHLLRGSGGLQAEVKDVRNDIGEVMEAMAAITVEEFTNPAAAVTDAVLASVASQAAAAAYASADLVGGAAVELDPPRNVTLTCDAGGGATWAGNLTVTGVDINGDALTEDIAFTVSATTAGAKAFARVDSLAADAQNDALGNWEVGFGDIIGLGMSLKSRAGGDQVLLEIVDGSVVGGGGGGASTTTGVTVDNETAVSQAVTHSGHAHFSAPIAEEVISVVADVLIAVGPLIVAAQPDFPRKLRVNITDADASITAGTVDLVGVGVDGAALSQSIPLTGGSQVVVTDDAYATLTSATITGPAGHGAGDNIGIGVDSALGLPIPAGAANVAVNKTCVDSADETVAGVDATARTVDPTSAPDAARDYDFYFSYELTTTQSAHNHGVTDGGHSHGAAGGAGGTFVDAATSEPNGTYEPDSAPDGAHDYALVYEYDPTA